MSSLRNLNKARARSHKERGQLQHRAHLGSLEKKKDYKLRAENFQRKQNTLKSLKRKALERNPDEFYFNMVKTQKVDGVHQRREGTEAAPSEAEIKLMYSQDHKYINMKRTTERKKIERLKSSLHLLDADDVPKNKHIIFVDSKKEAKNFDVAKHFNTHPSLLNRNYNRPTMEMLQKGLLSNADEETLQSISDEKKKKYKELKKRIEREKELNVISQKMEVKKQLMDKKRKKIKVKDETKDMAAKYKWEFKRQR